MLTLIWVNTLFLIAAVIILSMLVYRTGVILAQVQATLAQVQAATERIAEALSRVERISQATLDLVFRQSRGSQA